MTDFRNNTRVPRSWARNNPGNIRPSTQKWEGEVTSKNGFVVFSTMEYGIRALMHSIITNLVERKKTLREWISVYAPTGDSNQPNAYTAFVATKTGLDPDKRISYLSESDIKAIANAMAIQEDSTPLDSSWLNDAWKLVSAHRKALIQTHPDVYDREEKKKSINWGLPLIALGVGYIFIKKKKRK